MSSAAEAAGVRIKAHIKLDVGMGRLGFLAKNDNCIDEIKQVAALGGLDIKGIFTHFPSADRDGDDSGEITKKQAALFISRCNTLEKQGIHFETRHCCNSAGSLTIGKGEAGLDCVREGITLYGLSPSPALKGAAKLYPVMSLKTVGFYGQDHRKGRYGQLRNDLYGTGKNEACIGLHRLCRRISPPPFFKGVYAYKWQKAPIVGRVCMDQLMLDVTGIDGVKIGDEVTVFGKSGDAELSVDEVAAAADTINYELICILGKRVPRVFLKDGKVLSVTDYISSR